MHVPTGGPCHAMPWYTMTSTGMPWHGKGLLWVCAKNPPFTKPCLNNNRSWWPLQAAIAKSRIKPECMNAPRPTWMAGCGNMPRLATPGEPKAAGKLCEAMYSCAAWSFCSHSFTAFCLAKFTSARARAYICFMLSWQDAAPAGIKATLIWRRRLLRKGAKLPLA